MSILQKLSITATSAALLALATIAPAAAVSFYSLSEPTSSEILNFKGTGQQVSVSSDGQLLLQEQDGTVKNLGYPSCEYPGCYYNGVYGINEQGQILARTHTPPTHFPGDSDDILHEFDSLVLRNPDGSERVVVGYSGRGFFFSEVAFNNKGQVVYSQTYRYAFGSVKLWDNGTTYTLLSRDRFTSALGRPLHINDLGELVYSDENAYGQTNAFLGSTNLGTLGGTSSVPFDINNLSQVVGSSTTPSEISHAFLWEDDTMLGRENGTMFDLNNLILNNPGAELSSAYRINDKGQILAFGTLNGDSRTFLLTPAESQSVPEPTSTLGLLGLAAIGVTSGWLHKRQSP